MNTETYFLTTPSLDSEFLASTSTDGSARIWNTIDGVPLATLTRNTVCFQFTTFNYNIHFVVCLRFVETLFVLSIVG